MKDRDEADFQFGLIHRLLLTQDRMPISAKTAARAGSGRLFDGAGAWWRLLLAAVTTRRHWWHSGLRRLSSKTIGKDAAPTLRQCHHQAASQNKRSRDASSHTWIVHLPDAQVNRLFFGEEW